MCGCGSRARDRAHRAIAVFVLVAVACRPGHAQVSTQFPTAPRSSPGSSSIGPVASNGRLYILVERTDDRGNVEHLPIRYRYCGALKASWLALRGSWWVAVDSIIPCVDRGDSRAPASADTPLLAIVDSGYMAGHGQPPADTTVLESMLPRVLPATSAFVVGMGGRLTVRVAGTTAQRIYVLARP